MMQNVSATDPRSVSLDAEIRFTQYRRRAFKQYQPAADIDCTEPLSPVCDCRLHSG
jgi:hypothetical protein